MQILNSIADIQAQLASVRQAGKTIAFVPTMGNLHEGHLQLVDMAKTRADAVVVSIYVNPMQFGENEDLDSYPRTLQADCDHLKTRGAAYIFTPSDKDIYPEGKENHTRVYVPKLSEHHCGSSRPQFFGGIATVVTKLLNIIRPDIAIFGEKDFQQLAIIRKLVRDLCLPVDILGHPLVRSEDGLALSSRNRYLSDEERAKAPLLYNSLLEAREKIQSGENFEDIHKETTGKLAAAGFHIDYLNLADAHTLQPATEEAKDLVLLAAAMLGKTRLIDNLAFERP